MHLQYNVSLNIFSLTLFKQMPNTFSYVQKSGTTVELQKVLVEYYNVNYAQENTVNDVLRRY